MKAHPASLALLGLVLFSAPAPGQSNLRPGIDLRISQLDSGLDLVAQGHDGDYPTGRTGLSMSVTHCNSGSAPVSWEGDMQEDHPFTAFLILKEAEGRLIQISEYGFVKHEYFALSSNQCMNCTSLGDGSALAVGCSTTSGHGASGDRYFLGPQEEIDPWLGSWSAVGSYFDCPGAALVCDGVRSYFGSESSPVDNRIVVRDEALLDNTATYYYAAHDVVRGEAEALRENNLMSREFRPSWNGSRWIMDTEDYANPNLEGPILARWSGAMLESNTNGTEDGRVYIASKVEPAGPLFHYEYAVYNRDNTGGILSVSLPITPGAAVTNFGFHDVDSDVSNDWTLTVSAGILTVAGVDNPLRWNSLYNFWFDCDVAPVSTDALLTQAQVMGLAQPGFLVPSEGPGGAPPESYCFGDGGVAPGCTPCPCGNDAPPGSLGGCRNSSSRSAVLIRTGSGSVSNGDLSMTVQGANGNTFSLLNSADNRLPSGGGPCPAGSGVFSLDLLDGLRCIGGNLRRHGIRALTPQGESATPWGPPGEPAGGIAQQAGFQVGQTRQFQVIYRESLTSVCETGRNTSNAVTVLFTP